MKVDLNADMGESFGMYTLGNDAEFMKYITSANVACGFHAGDYSVMRQTVQFAKEFNVQVGAHPGLPDLQQHRLPGPGRAVRGHGGQRGDPRTGPLRRLGDGAAAQGDRGRDDLAEAFRTAEDPGRGDLGRGSGPRDGPVAGTPAAGE